MSGYYPGDFNSDYEGEGYFGGGSVGYGRSYKRDTSFNDGGDFGGFYEDNEDFATRGRQGNRSFDRSDDYERQNNRGGYYGRGRDSGRKVYSRTGYYETDDYDADDRGFFDEAGDEVSSWIGGEEATRRGRDDRRYYENHRGKGPKNYRRSDERIEEYVNDELSEDYTLDATNIEVSVAGGEVTLDGQVGSRSDKRRAEDIAHDISGVNHVQNNLRVKKYDYRNAEDSGFTKSGVTSTNANPTTENIDDDKRKSRKKTANS